MKMKKIAFVVAIPGTATAFLMDHFRALKVYYDVHLIANFPDEVSKKPFEEIGVVCHTAELIGNGCSCLNTKQ